MRELYHWRAVHVYDRHQARAGREHHLSWIFWPQAPFKREASCFGLEREEFGELPDVERTASDDDALEEMMRILPIVIVDVQ